MWKDSHWLSRFTNVKVLKWNKYSISPLASVEERREVQGNNRVYTGIHTSTVIQWLRSCSHGTASPIEVLQKAQHQRRVWNNIKMLANIHNSLPREQKVLSITPTVSGCAICAPREVPWKQKKKLTRRKRILLQAYRAALVPLGRWWATVCNKCFSFQTCVWSLQELPAFFGRLAQE